MQRQLKLIIHHGVRVAKTVLNANSSIVALSRTETPLACTMNILDDRQHDREMQSMLTAK
jgi:hypothetical protein